MRPGWRDGRECARSAYIHIGEFLASQEYIFVAYDDDANDPGSNDLLAHEVMLDKARYLGEAVHQTIKATYGAPAISTFLK